MQIIAAYLDQIDAIKAWLITSYQLDMIIMDFSKAFDMVPHERLWSKLHYLGKLGYVVNSLIESGIS